MYKENLSQQSLRPADNLRFLSPKVTPFPRSFEISHDEARAERDQQNVILMEDCGRRKEQFLSYIPTQLETLLGERFNVILSQFDYDIKDGQMYGKDMDEPFMESIKRGRDYRKENGNTVDKGREEAEVVGFEKIQQLLTDPETPIDTMMLSISPKGGEDSSYQHNFYDVFTLRKTRSGRRCIEVRRYASGLNIEDYKIMILPFANIEVDDNDPATSFLANPIAIQNTLTPDDLHQYFHREHETMEERTLNVIKRHCRELGKEYANAVWNDRTNQRRHKILFNAYLNKADEIKQNIEREGIEKWEKIDIISTKKMLDEDVAKYAMRQVREVTTGCGLSDGYEISKGDLLSPFSVEEYGKRPEDDPNLCKCGGDKPHFHCPGKIEEKDCNEKIIVGRGITECKKCGEKKKC